MTSTELTKPQEKDLQDRLERIHSAKAAFNSSIAVIGGELIAIREILPKKAFVPWVEKNCNFSKSTAYKYMSVFPVFGKFKRIENLDDEALYVLSKCEPAAEKAKAMANRGMFITREAAIDLVHEEKPVEPVGKAGNSPPAKAKPRIQTVEGDAAAEPSDVPPMLQRDDEAEGGWEPSEATKHIDKLTKALAVAARAHADAAKILGKPQQFSAVFEHIDAASIALDRFRKSFKKRK